MLETRVTVEKIRNLGSSQKQEKEKYDIKEGGHTLQNVILKSMVFAGKKKIWEDLQQIRQEMKKKRLAHTDIKLANVGVKFFNTALTDLKVYLINNNYISKYGEIRQFGTPGINVDQQQLKKEKVDQNTDERGYQFIKAVLEP